VLLATVQMLALCLPAGAQQGGRETPSGRFADPSLVSDRCWDSLYDRAGRREMPRALQAGLPRLMELLHPDKLVMENGNIERWCKPAVVAWPDHHPSPPTPGGPGTPGHANLYLVAFETIVHKTHYEGTMEEASRKLALALVRVSGDGDSWQAIAKTAEPLERKAELVLDRFDFAPYRLNEHETAFGLRSYFNTTYIGGGGHDQILELFRLRDDTIEPVLWTLIGSSNFVKGEQRGDPKGAVIRVLPEKTNGKFDLKKSVRGGGSQIFRWNGQRYETHDPEPVECFNEPCENIVRERSTQD
jgi:hypothetical protein